MDQTQNYNVRIAAGVYDMLAERARKLSEANKGNYARTALLTSRCLYVGSLLLQNQVRWDTVEQTLDEVYKGYFAPHDPLSHGWDGVGPSPHVEILRAWQSAFSLLWEAQIDYRLSTGQELVDPRAAHTLIPIHDVLFTLWPLDVLALHVRMTRLYYASAESIHSWPLPAPPNAIKPDPAKIRLIAPTNTQNQSLTDLMDTVRRLSEELTRITKG
jgi:hypothetical protein